MTAPSFVEGWSKVPILDAEYHARPEVSCHALLDFDHSPRLYHAKYITKTVQSDVTPAMAFGTLFHEAVLEPNKFMQRARGPDMGKTSKAWKDFIGSDPTGVHPDDYDQIVSMLKAILKHPNANEILSIPDVQAKREQVGFANILDVNMRMKCDMVTDGFLLDLKTTYDSSDKAFGYDADKYGYLFQACVYTQLAYKIDGKKRDFYILAVEKTQPHEVAIYSIPDAVLEKEMERFHYLLKDLRYSRANSTWGFKSPHVKPIWLTNYYFERMYER